MAKKARQSISYVLEHAKSSAGGHRLGVNGLAVDTDNGILYSGGRDGIVCAWDLNLNASLGSSDAPVRPTTKLRSQTHAHMHWINDITLAQNNTALVSASSDLVVKVWRPHSEVCTEAHAIGEHADYVKCVATPPSKINANWVASGGLDRKICLWDLNGAGKTLELDVRGEERPEKGSVYALAVGTSVLASGGPEKTIRLHDPRTGSKVSKLVGHLGNIRSILIDDADDIILSASADKTIKMWSVKEGRCIYTFTMHDESIWSLFSNDPRLGIFYSSDRSGLVAKTDVRGSLEEMDDGLSLAVVQENFGVCKVVAAAGHIWTATNRSSINRWEDIDTSGDVKLPEEICHQRASETSRRHAQPSDSGFNVLSLNRREVSAESVLRISNSAVLPARRSLAQDSDTVRESLTRRASEIFDEQPDLEVKPIYPLPEETIEGQCGLLKHRMLNDRRRVLTLDTAGDVLLWDLIACKPIQSFGKQHLEDVERTVNTREAVAPWCSVDLSSGNLTVVLEPFNCFDAEIYADELRLDEPMEFKEDQRSAYAHQPASCLESRRAIDYSLVILGRWILRYLFAHVIDEEIKRDDAHRLKLNEELEKRKAASRMSAPASIDLPSPHTSVRPGPGHVATPRANGSQLPVATPGLAIGLATPGPSGVLPGVREEDVAAEWSLGGDREDYFTGEKVMKAPSTPAADTPDARNVNESVSDKGKEKDKDKGPDNSKSPGTPFGRKFRLSFSSKKLRSLSQATQERPVVAEDRTEESESSSTLEKEIEDSFLGVIQKIHNEYDKQLAESPEKRLETLVTPSSSTETPVLKLPPGTRVIIQEETSGGSANIYQGTVESLGRDVDVIEKKAPMWLGEALLRNHIPPKEPVKVSFVLYPMGDLPPISPRDGTNRLNANRMLRVKKILAYVAERIEKVSEDEKPDGLLPEDYLELYCNDQLLDPSMSLATIRAHVWKGGSDIILYYKATGRKEIRPIGQSRSLGLRAEGSEAATEAPASTASEVETTAQVS